jgi:hypothetical protein
MYRTLLLCTRHATSEKTTPRKEEQPRFRADPTLRGHNRQTTHSFDFLPSYCPRPNVLKATL